MTASSVHPVDLEPSLVHTRTYLTRRGRHRLDVATLLTITIVLLYVLPGTLIVPELTYAGRPALLVALLLFFWWCLARINPWLVMVGPQPIRWALGCYLVSILLSYIAGMLRGLPTLESNAQNFALLLTLEFLGVALVAADGIQNWERLNRILRVLVWSSGFMAVVGIIQAALHVDISEHLTIPGLELKGGVVGFGPRGDQYRVAGTTTHYIEFSAVMAMMVPYAIHVARFAPKRIHRRFAALVVLLLLAANPMSISRTGIVALALAMLVMAPIWSWRLRYAFALMSVGVAAALMVLKPGLLGTLKAMFLNIGVDPSISGRTSDYDLVLHWFSQRPWLGRGPRTLVPELYHDMILDNQWLYTLVTGGIVGVVALLVLHVTAIALAAIALRRAQREEDRHLCVALISSQVVAMVVAGTFDSLYYTTFATTLALLTGLCGTLWRFTHPARTIRTSTVRRFVA